MLRVSDSLNDLVGAEQHGTRHGSSAGCAAAGAARGRCAVEPRVCRRGLLGCRARPARRALPPRRAAGAGGICEQLSARTFVYAAGVRYAMPFLRHGMPHRLLTSAEHRRPRGASHAGLLTCRAATAAPNHLGYLNANHALSSSSAKPARSFCMVYCRSVWCRERAVAQTLA